MIIQRVTFRFSEKSIGGLVRPFGPGKYSYKVAELQSYGFGVPLRGLASRFPLYSGIFIKSSARFFLDNAAGCRCNR
jgi:hypothetical protein